MGALEGLDGVEEVRFVEQSITFRVEIDQSRTDAGVLAQRIEELGRSEGRPYRMRLVP